MAAVKAGLLAAGSVLCSVGLVIRFVSLQHAKPETKTVLVKQFPNRVLQFDDSLTSNRGDKYSFNS
jgi:hypothetical protein